MKPLAKPHSCHTDRILPPRILLIDDDTALLASLAEMLTIRLQPSHIETCDGSTFALRMVQQGQYDVILCDVWMPGING